VEARGQALVFGRPGVILDKAYSNPRTGRTYDVARDGKRFLMIKDARGGADETRHLVLVQNWFDELERLAPPRR
jgi:hypothetical protein